MYCRWVSLALIPPSNDLLPSCWVTLSEWEGKYPWVSTLLRTLWLFTYLLLMATNPMYPLTASTENSKSLLVKADVLKLLIGGMLTPTSASVKDVTSELLLFADLQDNSITTLARQGFQQL